MEPYEHVEVFNPPSGPVEVPLLAAKCNHCGRDMVLASQMEENIKRRSARREFYGSHLLGEDIFAFRRKYGLTQQAASKVFGKGKIAFSRYETEASFPEDSTTKLLKMAMRFPHVLKALADEEGVEIPLWQERCEDERAAKVLSFKPVEVVAQPELVVNERAERGGWSLDIEDLQASAVTMAATVAVDASGLVETEPEVAYG
jgi:HTH-type transcriptional regulator/antitoxin MqsA